MLLKPYLDSKKLDRGNYKVTLGTVLIKLR